MEKNMKPVVYWLYTGCVLIFIMVAVGGLTRLTESGLSMVDWNLVKGAKPPVNEAEWIDLFEAYQTSPEFREKNPHFHLEDFKSIFWWEYIHRMIGRFIGVVFILPFLFFAFRGYFNRRLLGQLIILLALGSFQGFLGWYMVKSGLINEPRVSHYRLAAHLMTAFLSISYSFWIVREIIESKRTKPPVNRTVNKRLWWLLGLTAVQIMYGAFVAGRDAGTIHNFFPHMNPGEFISPAVFGMDPVWINFLENNSGIQFVHRTFAYAVVVMVFAIALPAFKSVSDSRQLRSLYWILGAVIVQFSLGVATLLLHVPIPVALLHQLGALVLLLSILYSIRQFPRA